MQNSRTFALRLGWIAIIAFCVCDSAQADAIIPYMVVPWGQVFLLPLVISLEAIVLWKLLRGSFKSNLFQSLIANIVSTVLGAFSYVLVSGFFGNVVFEWWFKGGFSEESIRGALISFGLAVVLWIISLVSEAFVIGRLREITISKPILVASAVANTLTYVLLLTMAFWFGREHHVNVEDHIDRSRTSQNVASTIHHDPAYPMAGFWKNNCADDFGLAIEAAGNGNYSIMFCGPGACGRRDKSPTIDLRRDKRYRIIDTNTIEELPAGSKLLRCATP